MANNPIITAAVSAYPKPPRQSDGRLRLGAISFINTLPMYHDGLTLPGGVDVYYAPPATLNQWMAEGRLDVSPVSSAFYLANSGRFALQPSLTVSSFGGVESVLFLTRPHMNMTHPRIVVPDDSATSVAVLKSFLAKRYPDTCVPTFHVVSAASVVDALADADGGLIIGDRALAIHCMHRNGELPKPLNTYTVHDLATEWYAQYKSPLVFAVWIAQQNLSPESAMLCTKAIHALTTAREAFFKSPVIQQSVLADVAERSVQEGKGELPYTHGDLMRYWTQALNFDFTPQHESGLQHLSAVLSLAPLVVAPEAVGV